MSIDVIGNFLTVVRNALMVSHRSATVPFSKMRVGISKVLQAEGYIKGFKDFTDENGRKWLTVDLKYFDGESVIHEIKRVSTPGRRYYENLRTMSAVKGGLGISILSTNVGIITDREAKRLAVGGEVLCSVW
jgi:small subunit ribosomal protein S8